MEAIIASAVLPAALDMIKGIGGAVSRRFFGLSIDDQIKLSNVDIERLKAVAQLDSPAGTPSQWVVDLRASFRYIAAGVVILIGSFLAYLGFQGKDHELMAAGLELAGMPFGFIFGERMWQGLKAKK